MFFVALFSPAAAGLAQPGGDEPGVGSAPPPPTSAPSTSAPTPTPAPETPQTGQPAALVLQAQACRAGLPCLHFAGLIWALTSPGAGPGAARLMGQLGDPRGVAPLAITAVYGISRTVREEAAKALEELGKRPATRPVVLRLARADADQAVRAAAARAVGGFKAVGAGASTPQRADAPDTKRSERPSDPDATRGIYGSTAFSRQAGTWSWTIFNVGYWRFNYGVNDYLELGLDTMPPIMAVAFVPNLKVSFPLGESARLGIKAMGGVLYPYIENDDDVRFAIFGGGPTLTIGDPDLYLNVGVMVYGLVHGEQQYVYDPNTPWGNGVEELEHESVWAVLPTVGFGWRFSRRLKLNVELHAVTAEGFEYSGEFWVLIYGLRIFGERIYGDVSFALPFWPEMGEIMKYMPVGFPLLTFGFLW